MFHMMGAFVEFERAMIHERINSGLTRARAQGAVLGRPRVPEDLERAREGRTAMWAQIGRKRTGRFGADGAVKLAFVGIIVDRAL
jgi:DNA invertase Pin-like site-specific DNA recombinase